METELMIITCGVFLVFICLITCRLCYCWKKAIKLAFDDEVDSHVHESPRLEESRSLSRRISITFDDDDPAVNGNRIALTVNGSAMIELPMGPSAMSLAQQIIDMHGRDPETISIKRSDRSGDAQHPPNYHDLNVAVEPDVASSGESRVLEAAPPGYETTAASSLPPSYDDIQRMEMSAEANKIIMFS